MIAENNDIQAVENQEKARLERKQRGISRIRSRRISSSRLSADGSCTGEFSRIKRSPAIESDSESDSVDMEAPGIYDESPGKEHSGRGFSEIFKKDNSRIEKDTMTENIFSLIFTAPVSSAAFWMGIFVSSFQIFMPALALSDLILFSDSLNPLQAPNGVSSQVRISGAMALVLAVVQFFDFMEAIEKLQKGPPPHSVHNPRGASCCKFYLAYILQFIMGCVFLTAIFTLVVQSTMVVEMFLNFAALEFIVMIDDFVFALAKRGYFTNSIKEYCDEVSETVVLRRKGGRCSRRIQIFVTMSILLACFAWIELKEESGNFDCKQVEVQFGDGFMTLLPVFSGIYTYKREFYDGRPVYLDKHGNATFRYCQNGNGGIFSFAESGYWVFNIFSENITSIDMMCRDYISRSPETKGYDILEQPASTWLTKHRVEDSVEYTVDYFNLRCADCDKSTCNGKCEGLECVCTDKERYGTHCQYTEEPCEETDFDRRTSPFSGAGIRFSSDYFLLRNGKGEPSFAYNRPIYFHLNAEDGINILMNLGRRYFLFYLNATLIPEIDKTSKDIAKLADYLEKVHPYYDWIEPEYMKGESRSSAFHVPVFVSDPIDIGTATDNVSPLGLSWSRVSQIQLDSKNFHDIFLIGSLVDTVLLCASCSNETSLCINGGICDQNHKCHCTMGHVGRLCEEDCWESPENDLCPRCFSKYKSDNSCASCYVNSSASDCPDCRNDPFAFDCID